MIQKRWKCVELGCFSKHSTLPFLGCAERMNACVETCMPRVTGVPGVASLARKYACGAESAGFLWGENEPFCKEASTEA